jgi:hypothetical protein
MGKLVALISGGDWADASVQHLVLPDGMDLEVEKVEYLKTGGYRKSGKFFDDWLISRGATAPSEEQLQIIDLRDGEISLPRGF